MSKKTVLFVDDELNVLEGLRTRLHRQRSKWDMIFVLSGKRRWSAWPRAVLTSW
ncbi:MAG: hypothetical protein QM757_23380 [Paludibaculum sp.]